MFPPPKSHDAFCPPVCRFPSLKQIRGCPRKRAFLLRLPDVPGALWALWKSAQEEKEGNEGPEKKIFSRKGGQTLLHPQFAAVQLSAENTSICQLLWLISHQNNAFSNTTTCNDKRWWFLQTIEARQCFFVRDLAGFLIGLKPQYTMLCMVLSGAD